MIAFRNGNEQGCSRHSGRLGSASMTICKASNGSGKQWMSAARSAPFAGAATGANPTDRGKQGTKRSLLTDGAGIPLALVVDGANRHDVRLRSRYP